MEGLTPERRAELRALLEKASPGEWGWNGYSRIVSIPKARDEDDGPQYPDDKRPGPPWFSEEDNAWLAAREAAYNADSDVCSVPAHHGDTATGPHAADARLIEVMRNALPALLDIADECDRLEKLVAVATDWRDAAREREMSLAAERDAALKRAAELEAEKERQAGLSSGGASPSAYQHAIDRADALAVELAELRQTVVRWVERGDSHDRDHCPAADKLRTLAAQPQGERGAQILAEHAEMLRALGRVLNEDGFEDFTSPKWGPIRILYERLAAIDGAQPEPPA